MPLILWRRIGGHAEKDQTIALFELPNNEVTNEATTNEVAGAALVCNCERLTVSVKVLFLVLGQDSENILGSGPILETTVKYCFLWR